MEEKVLEAIERFSLLNGEKTVTVALSGGADSMALLYALNALKCRLGINVKAAHLNHMIRGAEALRDEEFVREQCRKTGTELFCESADVPLFAKQNSLSTELAARRLRYDFLNRVSGDGLVATAHTASDNLETVILNLTRGAALEGLCGIPAKRDKFIRPLLLVTRTEIEEYCAKQGISYITDSTNLSDDYTRNRIRHNVIPVLKGINPAVEKSVTRTVFQLNNDNAIINGIVENELNNRKTKNGGLALENVEKLPLSVSTRLIKRFIEEKVPDISLENVHITACLNGTVLDGKRTSLPKDLFAVNRSGVLLITDGKTADFKTISVSFDVENAEILKNNDNVNNLLLNNLIDCDKIVGKLVTRTRLPGDSIRTVGRGCTKTLNKLFSEMKIDTRLRDSIPVISDDSGVVWVYGVGIADRCAVTPSSKRIIIIKIQGE